MEKIKVKDEKLRVYYGRTAPTGEPYDNERLGAEWEGVCLEPGKESTLRAQKWEEIRAEVEIQIAFNRQDRAKARETAEPVGPVRDVPDVPPTYAGPVPSPAGPPPDPAEVPDAEAWYGKFCNGMRVSDMSKKDIDFYLGSGIVMNAEASDTRVQRFKTALEYWRPKAGDRRKGR